MLTLLSVYIVIEDFACYWEILHVTLIQSSERSDRVLIQVSFAESREVGE
jgi:hypothetical protein